ncbi:hypothetical protein LMJ53_13810 [Rheinheimera sp. UJ51]|uniref:hypothetical protein n=1 Tax=Rheinheimera sp. UJ51 TaxID=2892446 RepID=UPI001E4C9229|nr:hypothetical protein [Rheinheimera sp. UJ51]MCC5452799.1 hypothetical protein [Rheinheimera sp. UJ51]
MRKSLLWVLLALIAIFSAFQAGKWIGKNMALPVPEHLPAPTNAIETEAAISSSALASTVKALPDTVNKTTDTPETTEGSHDFTGTVEPFDLRQVLPQTDGSASIELNQAFLSLSKAQLQEAMWLLEQHVTHTSSYDRQKRLQQQLQAVQLGQLQQLNCSDSLCVALLTFNDASAQKAANLTLGLLSLQEQGQSTLLQKNTSQHYASFLLLYGWPSPKKNA